MRFGQLQVRRPGPFAASGNAAVVAVHELGEFSPPFMLVLFTRDDVVAFIRNLLIAIGDLPDGADGGPPS